MSNKTPGIQIKGLRDSLMVTLDDGSWDDVRSALVEQIEDRQAFFQGARLVLDVGAQVLHVNDLVSLRDHLSERGINLWAVLSESPTTEKTTQLLGMATRLSKPQPVSAKPTVEVDDESAMWINRTLRSGTRIEFPGNVVVVGDVNPGAEIVAGGSVIIWGRLRGVVHAGADGDQSAKVCALELTPTQLRIAGEVAIQPDKKKKSNQAEVVYYKDGHILAEPWKSG